MTQQHVRRLIIMTFLLGQFSIYPAAEIPHPTDSNRYLNAVRTFADNVLKCRRGTYWGHEIAYDALWKETS